MPLKFKHNLAGASVSKFHKTKINILAGAVVFSDHIKAQLGNHRCIGSLELPDSFSHNFRTGVYFLQVVCSRLTKPPAA